MYIYLPKGISSVPIEKAPNHMTTFLKAFHILNVHCFLCLPQCLSSTRVRSNNGYYHCTLMEYQALFKAFHERLLWWSCGEQSTWHAGDTGSIPGLGRFYLLPCATRTKPVPVNHNSWAHAPQPQKPMCPRACAQQRRSHGNEKPGRCNQRGASARCHQRKSAYLREDPAQSKINKNKVLKKKDTPRASPQIPSTTQQDCHS